MRLALLILLVATVFGGLGLCAFSLGDGGVRHAMETASPQAVDVKVAGVVNAENFATFDRIVREQAIWALGGEPRHMTTLLRSDGYAMPGQENVRYRPPERLRFDSFDGFQQHARLVSGSWPRSRTEPIEATISQAAASYTGLKTGQVFTTVGRIDAKPVKVRITGVFVPEDPRGPRWADDPMFGPGVQRDGYTTYGPLMVNQATFLDHFATTVDATWTITPDLRGLSLGRLREAATRLAGLRERFQASGCPDCAPFSALPETLARQEAGASAARWTVLSLTAALALALVLLPSPGQRKPHPGTAVLVACCAIVAPFAARPLFILAGALPWWPASGLRPPPPGLDAGSLLPAMAMGLLAAVLLLVEVKVPRPGTAAIAAVVAVTAAVVAAGGAATWRTSQVDQATHLTGAELRLTGPAAGGEPDVLGRGTAFAALPGVTAAVAGHRDRTDVDLRRSTLLGIDADHLADVMRLGSGLSDRSVTQMAAAMAAGRPRIGALPLPGTPRTLTVETVAPAGPPRLRVVLSDALGVWHHLPVAPLSEGTTKADVDLAGLAGPGSKIAYPLAVRGFLADSIDDSPHVVTVTALRADGREVALPEDQRWSEGAQDGTGLFSLKVNAAVAVVRPVPVDASPDRPLPIVLTPELATSAKLSTGETGFLALGRQRVQVQLAGVVEHMPGIPLDEPGALVDLPSLQAWNLALARPPLPATDWWLAGDVSGVRAAVAGSGWDVTVIDPRNLMAVPPGLLPEALALVLVTGFGLLLGASAGSRGRAWWSAGGLVLGLVLGTGLCNAVVPWLVSSWQGGTLALDVVPGLL
ncbi:hypothetical protein FH608_049610 [Nonomuraea phyllanthi]|uniref:Uncharacterized protein n=1 Tax=Nonomuraea phyllanthi TaxID=2219224 RepID=A0A5C4UWG1_9ACTN|nr:hypothetical protein [Nonomuraea phyllanthi]KAB8182984.1 hypothetical protein FH608_049610 [Nonomuraea phyllanthi]